MGKVVVRKLSVRRIGGLVMGKLEGVTESNSAFVTEA